MRSQSGNVDSARLLMEFSMVPSVKSGGSKLHDAAASGDIGTDNFSFLLQDNYSPP